MKPYLIGRVMGVATRVGGRIVGQAILGSGNAAASQVSQGAGAPQPARQRVVATGNLARGVGGFLKPFRRVGGIIWLEVTGVLFLLPVIAFTPNLLRMRASWAQGADHNTFLVTAGVVAVFLYLSVTSFWRARRK